MFICPICNIPLKTVHGPTGVFWRCPSCDGRSATIALLRKLVPAPIINNLWQSAKSGTFPVERVCPGCGKRMAEIPVTGVQSKQCLDVCTRCQTVWFDFGEYAALPPIEKRPKPYENLPQAAREKLALLQIKIDRENAEKTGTFEYTPDNWWEWVVCALGMPVEQESKPINSVPWITFGLSLFLLLFGLLTFLDLEPVVQTFGLVPAYLGRYGGLTFITSFFVHANIFHLFSNIYFLYVFGDDVEDWLGKKRFLLLLFSATLTGGIVHCLIFPDSYTPCIGASGGISGVIAFYAIKFPYAKLGFLMRAYLVMRWISIPAYVMFILWILLQLLGAYKQLLGMSHIASLTHLAGAGVGVLFWLTSRKN